MVPKKYDAYKTCVIKIPHDEFEQVFTTEWSYKDIRHWMLDTFCIDEDSIIEIQVSFVTVYKIPNND